jgi:RNA polymerase sigma-70 factor (ECF subfamily)
VEALTDFELVRRTKEGSSDAFSLLVARYEKPLQQLSLRYVKDKHLAEDVVQESFLKAYGKAQQFSVSLGL